jgi:hypothetical protein
MRLPRRRTIWLSAALLLAVSVGLAWLLVPRSRITQANFDLIRDGMSIEEVTAILGADASERFILYPAGDRYDERVWISGANWIAATFDRRGALFDKQIRMATPWQTVTWYAQMIAEKIGVKWD